MSFERTLRVVVAAATLLPCGASWSCQSNAVRMLVGFSAGGGTDVTARMLAARLTSSLGRPITVENRPGAGGMIATSALTRAPADGCTLSMAAAADAVHPFVRRDLPYDIRRDVSPISLVVTVPFALAIHPSVPAKTVADLVRLARARPGQLNFASSGIASSAHLSNELFNAMAQVRMVHVPYGGVAEGITALATGEVDMLFSSFPAAMPLARAKRVRLIAVSTSYRSDVAPDLPTVAESGLPGYARYGWYGVLAPRGVPEDVVRSLSSAIGRVMVDTEFKKALLRRGLEPKTTTPTEFQSFLEREVAQAGKLVSAAGIAARR